MVPKAAGHGGPVSCGTPFGPPVTSESVEPVSPAMMEAETDETWPPTAQQKQTGKLKFDTLEGGCWYMTSLYIMCVPSIHDTCDI